MISRITGKIIERGNNHLVIETGGICYDVMIPSAVMQRLNETTPGDGDVTLKTFHYLQTEPSKSFPVLIGFVNDVEKDFFQIFITVSGIGPRAALKALNKPISLIARAIDEGDVCFLRSLPGIGEQRAREIVAKLQHKVGKFGLIQDVGIIPVPDEAKNITNEALEVLTQLEYRRAEAMAMIKKALDSDAGIKTTEELLNVVYKQKKTG